MLTYLFFFWDGFGGEAPAATVYGPARAQAASIAVTTARAAMVSVTTARTGQVE